MNESILTTLNDGGNPTVTLVLLSLACLRIWMEIVQFDFAKLPVSQKLFERRGPEALKKFHRSGLYFSLGYLLLFAPGLLLGH